MLTVDSVSKAFHGAVALDDVSLSVAPGSVTGLIGPNGAGKTTLIRICTGLLASDAGSVHVGGHNVATDRRRALAQVGYAPQATGVYRQRTVRANLRHFGRLAGLNGARVDEAVAEVGAALDLEDRMDDRVAHLSGGLTRRVHVGVALLGRPGLVILDEPTANVDIDSRNDLLTLVRKLADEGTAVLYSTHYLPEIEELGAAVVMLLEGRVVASGSIPSLVADHGGDVLEVRFSKPPGELPPIAGVHVTAAEEVVSYRAVDRGLDVSAVLASLGPIVDLVLAVEVRRPSLDTVYRQMRRTVMGTLEEVQ